MSDVDPQTYSARTAYRRPAAWYLRLDGIGVALTSLGLAPRGAVTLAVRGRTSGKLRRLPILTVSFAGADHLVALAGESQWVRNVRAVHGRARLRRGRRRDVVLREVPVAERAAVLRAYLDAARERGGSGRPPSRPGSTSVSTWTRRRTELAAIAPYYPVFRVEDVVRA